MELEKGLVMAIFTESDMDDISSVLVLLHDLESEKVTLVHGLFETSAGTRFRVDKDNDEYILEVVMA